MIFLCFHLYNFRYFCYDFGIINARLRVNFIVFMAGGKKAKGSQRKKIVSDNLVDRPKTGPVSLTVKVVKAKIRKQAPKEETWQPVITKPEPRKTFSILKRNNKEKKPDDFKEKLEIKPKEVKPERPDYETLENLEIKNEYLAEKVERQKRIIMWSGVLFFMLLIASVWVYNAKIILQAPASGSSSDFSLDDFEKMSEEIGKNLSEMQEDYAAIKNYSASSTEASNPASGSITTLPASQEEKAASSSLNNSQLNQQELEALKNKLNELEKKLENK